MGGDGHGSRSGRYVGSFLQLFDWNAKSKKKLFSSKTDFPEPKQRTKNKENFPMKRIHLEKDEEFGERLKIGAGNDYSCASSVTDEDVCEMKAPSVVARLMGLDSIPAPNTFEPYATFFGTQSLRDSSFRRKDYDLYEDHQIRSSRNLIEKVVSPPRKALELRPQKMLNRPIEKFQTEMLPPRSAKTIPITHHKLLSPIKSPIFVPSQDAAHIMEAAAKIIEPGTQDTPRKRISSNGSSSVPFKVRELRDKMEAVRASKATETSIESKTVKHHRGNSVIKIGNGSVQASSFRAPLSIDDDCYEKRKGKSISLAIQAKVNVKKREGSTPSSTSLERHEEQDETTSIQSFKSHTDASMTMNTKSSTQSTSTVLRQNNQKQNCSTYRGKISSKTSNTTSTMAVSDDTSSRRQKRSAGDAGTYRTASRKSRLRAREGGDKDFPHPGVRNVPRKKRSIDSSTVLNRNQVTDNLLSGKHEKLPKCDTATDVISFTFSAPITQSLHSSQPTRQVGEKSGNLFLDRGKKMLCSDSTMLSLPGLNGIGSDSLSFMLEKKLQELMPNFESKKEPQVNDTKNETYSSSSNNPENIGCQRYFQAPEAVNKHSGTKPDIKLWDDIHLPSPVSVLETLTESCNSSESMTSSSTEESKPFPSVLAQQVLGTKMLKKSLTKETEADISDSASSTSSLVSSAKDPMKLTTWEVAYIQDILFNAEFNMYQIYTTGDTHMVVNQNLIDQIEKGAFRLERKLLFDCISECLDSKCQSFVGGGFELWDKGIATLKRKERLAEEVQQEIQGWRSLRKRMVDEVVDRDMSSKYGRWVDFEIDGFMVGVEIEAQIIDSLVLGIVDDFFPCNLCLYRASH